MSDQTTRKEADSTFFLKILLYFLLGSVWITTPWLPIPIGLMLGVIYAHHDHFQIDRKLEYVILLLAAVISFAVPIGLVIGIT